MEKDNSISLCEVPQNDRHRGIVRVWSAEETKDTEVKTYGFSDDPARCSSRDLSTPLEMVFKRSLCTLKPLMIYKGLRSGPHIR